MVGDPRVHALSPPCPPPSQMGDRPVTIPSLPAEPVYPGETCDQLRTRLTDLVQAEPRDLFSLLRTGPE